MNWYKAAAKRFNFWIIGDNALVTPAEFGAITWGEKHLLSLRPNTSPLTQRLFFTQEYKRKDEALHYLAQNRGIHPETQRLFFTERYERKNPILQYLAQNPNITPETQLLFLTEEYSWKDLVLETLERNKNFLRGDFTPEQWLEFKNAARGRMRLNVLSKRLEQLKEIP